ncbi:hypothetical protein JMJ77_0005427 [Colletotrichum scovillei]|uniref:Uncharacterized protein n=1 Tax=Colletotrichum scovillei TaxID=1209932 RepID=A0A9P7RJ05_9PEZI|nr:hypothetical protein JMJ77_0005427 [Colletotrichum scovillei]KAG7076683.1 hypothetical protein JMJ76_0013944 [Colletotrichum scovillei]KAG7083836.1 hypothetical protein JMJ78_0009278 [Colletotrichum scovillei]
MAVADRIQEWYTKEGTVNYQSFISEVSHGLGNSDGGARNIPTRRSSLEEQIHGQLFDANFVQDKVLAGPGLPALPAGGLRLMGLPEMGNRGRQPRSRRMPGRLSHAF